MLFCSRKKVEICLPSKGTASEVAGIVSATMFKNTVKLSNIVTPAKGKPKGEHKQQKIQVIREATYLKLF